MQQRFFLAFLSAIVLFISVVALPQSASAWTYDIYRGPNVSSRVILSYDDCPPSVQSLRSVLTYVQSANIGLVLAPTGQCIDDFKRRDGVDIALLARQHGQYTINHSRTHKNLTSLTYDAAVAEISGDVIADHGRPPYGALNDTVRRAYASRGMRIWLWRIDTEDWRNKTTDQVVNHVVAYSRPGETTLMHMQWRGFSPAAISRMKAGLENRGLYLCRAHRGYDNTGPVIQAPRWLLDQPIPC